MTPVGVVAAALTGASVGLLVPGGTLLVRGVGRASVPPSAVVGAVTVAGGAAWLLLSGTTLVLALVGSATVLAVSRALVRARAAAAADRRAEQVLLACEAMAGDLAAGEPPVRVLERGAAEWPELGPLATAGRLGADVPAVLRELARAPGADQLRAVAAAWQVAHTAGSGLAAALDQVAGSIREHRRTQRLVAAELSAARATARMMAVLPVGVLLMGAGIGGNPVGFLTGTPAGLGCLVVGLLLSQLGLFWLQRIADGVLGR